MKRDRTESFYRLLNKRMIKLKLAFKSLRSLANKSNYNFNQGDINEILQLIDEETEFLQMVYTEELNSGGVRNREIDIPFKKFMTIEQLERSKNLHTDDNLVKIKDFQKKVWPK